MLLTMLSKRTDDDSLEFIQVTLDGKVISEAKYAELGQKLMVAINEGRAKRLTRVDDNTLVFETWSVTK